MKTCVFTPAHETGILVAHSLPYAGSHDTRLGRESSWPLVPSGTHVFFRPLRVKGFFCARTGRAAFLFRRNPEESGHGRIEQRNITTSEALVGYSDWPGLAQVFEVGRHVITPKTGKERAEVVYGVTSLRPERATPERLLELVRGHWSIENKSHWVRDVTFDEDRSQVRCGNIPHVMAALRNTTIGLLRWAGHTNIAAACRRLAAQPVQALALIGIAVEN